MSKINMNKGFDYSKVPCILETPRGVRHLPDSTTKEENCIIVAQQWCPIGYSIYNAGEYLGLKCYSPKNGCTFGSVSDYKHTAAEERTLSDTGYQPWREDAEYGNVEDTEMRIYPDLTCALVCKSEYGLPGEKQEKYCVIVNEMMYSMKPYWAMLNRRTGLPRPAYADYIRFVSTDEEVRALATQMPENYRGRLLSSMGHLKASDLTRRVVYGDTFASRNPAFTSETRELVEEFFNVRGTENEKRRRIFCKKNHLVCSPDSIVLNSVKDLITWITITLPVEKPITKRTDGKESQDEHAVRLTKLFEAEWSDPENSKYQNTRLWAREGDEIVLVLPSYDNGYTHWYDGANGKKKVFSFNTKTRKRFMAEFDGTCWTFPVPSIKYVAQKLALTHVDGSGKNKNVTRIKGGLTVRELFDKTNIAWILDNVDDEAVTLQCTGNSYGNLDHSNLINVKKALSSPDIGTLALEILVSSGVPIMEQLLKSKMFNLYFCMLEGMLSRTNHFADRDTKSGASAWANLPFHGKQKNLKKMFDMRLDQIRMIDKKCIPYDRYAKATGDSVYYDRNVPGLDGIKKVFGCPISDIDNDSFERILKLATYNSIDWKNIGDLIVTAMGCTEESGTRVKQIVNLIETYSNKEEEKTYGYRRYNEGLQIYRDYLNSRRQLKNLQEANPALTDVFSEKRYPIKPGKARRFIPYVEGMRDTRYSWTRSPITSEERFLGTQKTIYADAYAREDMQVVKAPTEDGTGMRVTGVVINMTPRENARFLHDDAAFWVDFHKDASQDAAFKAAVKRVKPLEWKDPKSGLEIVAPTDVRSLKEEGHTLSHCVGGYADAIIGGKDNIMFLRRSDMPSHPFFTVEIVHDGEIRQVHCYSNLNPTEEDIKKAYSMSGYEVYNKTFDIQGFLKKWATAMKGKVDAKSIHPRYRALCALR